MTQPVPDPAALNDLYEALKEMVDLAEPNIYPCPDKPESAWGVLTRAKAALDKAEQANEWDEVFK